MNSTTSNFQFGENLVPRIPLTQRHERSVLAYIRPFQLDILQGIKDGVKLKQIARNIWNEPALAKCQRYKNFDSFYVTFYLTIRGNKEFFYIS